MPSIHTIYTWNAIFRLCNVNMLTESPNSHLCSWHLGDFMYRLKRKPACVINPQQAILLQTPLQAPYLISSHSVAWPKLNKATIGVPHAVDAVRGFKASNLEKKVREIRQTCVWNWNTDVICFGRWSFNLPMLICRLFHGSEYADKARVVKLNSKLITPKYRTFKYFNLFSLLSEHVPSPRSSQTSSETQLCCSHLVDEGKWDAEKLCTAAITHSQAQPTDPAAQMDLLQQQLHRKKKKEIKLMRGRHRHRDKEQKSCHKACLNCWLSHSLLRRANKQLYKDFMTQITFFPDLFSLPDPLSSL